MDKPVIAVDFDGTLCENTFPYIGKEIPGIIDDLINLQHLHGAKLILWTCRRDELLRVAVEWCAERGLVFDAVNGNLPENIKKYGGDTRKVSADYYIDDRNAVISELTERYWDD